MCVVHLCVAIYVFYLSIDALHCTHKLESAELRDGIAQYTSECNSQRRAQSAQSGKRTSSWSRLGFAYDGKDAYMTSYRNEMKNHALETAARKQQAATIRLMQADKTKKAYRPQFSAAMGLGYGRRHAAYRNYFAILRDVPVGVPEESPGSRSRRQSQGSRAPDNNNNMPPVVGVGQMPRPQSVPRGGARSRPRTGSPAAQAN
jgi:hypothetical protein